MKPAVFRFAQVGALLLASACELPRSTEGPASPRGDDGPLVSGGPTESSTLELRLEVGKPSVSLAAPHEAEWKVVATNRGPEPLTLVLAGDGSSVGWRTPRISWRLRDAEGRAVEARGPGGRCGNVNALKPDEIVELAAGESVAFAWIDWPGFPGPGEYSVEFRYEHDPTIEWSGLPLAEHDAAAMKRVRRTPPIAATSNAITVRVAASES